MEIKVIAVFTLALTALCLATDFWRIDKPRKEPFRASGFLWNMLYYIPVTILAIYALYSAK